VDASKYSARAKAYHPLDSGLERVIRKALVELAEPVDINMMIAILFDRVIDAVDADAGFGPDDFGDDYAITRRRLRELINKELDELDDLRFRTMVNTKDAVYTVAKRLASLIDDCFGQGILNLPSVPRPPRRRQTPRGARRNHRKPSPAAVQRGAA
jgi:hypothetical protein